MGKKTTKNRAAFRVQPKEQSHIKIVKRPAYGTRLRKYVDLHGIKLTWMARVTHISYSRVYRFYVGVTEPKVSEGQIIARALNCRLEDIFEVDYSENGDDSDLKSDNSNELKHSPSGNHSPDLYPACANCHFIRENNSGDRKDGGGTITS